MLATPAAEKVRWWLPLVVAVSTAVALLLLFVYSPYSGFLYLFLVAPFVCLIFVVLLVVAGFCKRPRQFLSLFVSLFAFVVISVALLKNENTLRDHARWLLESRWLKA
ncbi:MAG: hypothetical protein WAL41_14245, partial [Mycobacterium sp.]